jgi:hypothetical protein
MANIADTKAAAQKAIDYSTKIHQQGEGYDKMGWRYNKPASRRNEKVMSPNWPHSAQRAVLDPVSQKLVQLLFQEERRRAGFLKARGIFGRSCPLCSHRRDRDERD